MVRGDLATLYLDGAESSALDIADPHHLEFEYMQHIRLIIDSMYDEAAPLRVLHLGAAGCALARALDADRPGSRQLAIELDEALASYVREWFDLPPSPRLRIRADEARRALETTKARWDVIVRDAFAQRTVPAHLRTCEAVARAHAAAPHGLYLLNSVASSGIGSIGDEAATLFESFAHVIAMTDPAVLKGRRFGNVVLAASDDEFDESGIERAVRRLSLPATFLTEADLRRRIAGVQPLRDADIGYSAPAQRPELRDSEPA
ncbi:fused MFS/spermidine synthase [Arcanobacterium haemolyticum]|nr:fused MFS/spermidine synthase [Arcanobacterium haemolyticum]